MISFHLEGKNPPFSEGEKSKIVIIYILKKAKIHTL